MKNIRQKITIRKVKDITMGSTLVFTILGGVVSVESCVGTQKISALSFNSTDTLQQGICSYIREVAENRFQIFDEKKVNADSTKAVIERLNGEVDTLTLDVAKALIDSFLDQRKIEIGANTCLENVLLFGGIGYILARDSDNIYAFYRSKYESSARTMEYDSTENYWDKPFLVNEYLHWGYYFYNRFYYSPTVYRRCIAIRPFIFGPRIVLDRPYHSSTGHFTYHHSYTHIGG